MTATKEKKKIYVANRNELSVGLGKQVSVDGVELALFLQDDGAVNAIENACPIRVVRSRTASLVGNTFFARCMTGKLARKRVWLKGRMKAV